MDSCYFFLEILDKFSISKSLKINIFKLINIPYRLKKYIKILFHTLFQKRNTPIYQNQKWKKHQKLTDMMQSGVKYNKQKLIISKSSESYFFLWDMQMVSVSLFPSSFVIVCTQTNLGALYNALVTHTPTMTN